MLVFEFLRRELKLNELKNVASASEALCHQQVAKAADSLFFKPGVAIFTDMEETSVGIRSLDAQGGRVG